MSPPTESSLRGAPYIQEFDDRMAIVIFRPEEYQGRSDVVLYAMFDFAEAKDRAGLLAGGKKCDTRAFLLSARV
jgi:hypothetical protein